MLSIIGVVLFLILAAGAIALGAREDKKKKKQDRK